MTLEQVIPLIHESAKRMTRDYGRTLFDELAIVRVEQGKLHLEWYDGPRREEFIRDFYAETAELKSASMAHHRGHYSVGEFDFTHAGAGSKSDAFMKLGEDAYLVCGNTKLSMTEITAGPRWLKAQHAFALLGEKMITDPLVFKDPPTGPAL